MTTDDFFTSTSFLIFCSGGGSWPISPRPVATVKMDIDVECEEACELWLPFTYGLDSDPI